MNLYDITFQWIDKSEPCIYDKCVRMTDYNDELIWHVACLWINRSVSWEDAVYWYEQAVKTHDNDEGGQFDCTINDPSYTLMAKQAEMYRQGGHGLDKDPQRAGMWETFV